MNPETQALIKANLNLVRHIAHRYKTERIDFDDLYQEGCIGLIKAAKGYDGVRKFSIYAGLHIKGSILHYIRDRANTVRGQRGKQLSSVSLNRVLPSLEGEEEMVDQIPSPCYAPLCIGHVLELLTPKQQYIFKKYHLEGYSMRDIAKNRRTNVQVVSLQLSRIETIFKQNI